MTEGQQIRWTVHFSGRVQGVGFRATCRHYALRHPVSGTVQNLMDGRVKLVAEGTPANLQALLDEVQHQMERHIRDTEILRGEATGEFNSFRIVM